MSLKRYSVASVTRLCRAMTTMLATVHPGAALHTSRTARSARRPSRPVQRRPAALCSLNVGLNATGACDRSSVRFRRRQQSSESLQVATSDQHAAIVLDPGVGREGHVTCLPDSEADLHRIATPRE